MKLLHKLGIHNGKSGSGCDRCTAKAREHLRAVFSRVIAPTSRPALSEGELAEIKHQRRELSALNEINDENERWHKILSSRRN
jgi:hypothetical protein